MNLCEAEGQMIKNEGEAMIGREIVNTVHSNSDLTKADEEKLFLSSYCSFFDEYSENYGKI
jgi:hypothetical protein